ncbi:phosphate butyryltransferase [Coprothermobacter platensis]|uniref:phosphate butyryltransferase n=1 Tax=Coprothermobacter platensis TaxID=108819 RepID=UPI000365A92D
MNNFDELLETVKKANPVKVSVAQADDEEVIETVKMATENGIAQFYLVGNGKAIQEKCSQLHVNMSQVEIVDEPDLEKTPRTAVSLVSSGKAQVLMKGLIHTADYLKAVLDKEIGLRKDKSLLSHVGVFQVPAFDHFIVLTDAAMIIAPDLGQKVSIIENAVMVARALGIETPKVAALSAVETVNPDMPSSVEAAILAKMGERGQIKNCIIDGPLAFDNAVSKEAAEHKGIHSPVAGAADILLVPDIEAGNILYKSFTYAAGATMAGIVVGARAPIVLTSRADTAESKLYSIALAVQVANAQVR